MNTLAAIAAVIGVFGTGLSQHARLITLASAQDRALPESLMAEQFTGREAVNELFVFDVDALSVSTDLDLSLFISQCGQTGTSTDSLLSMMSRQANRSMCGAASPRVNSEKSYPDFNSRGLRADRL